MPRIYVSQSVIDGWLSERRAQLEGDLLRMSAPQDSGGASWTFFLNPAVLFEAVDGEEPDSRTLLGCVRSIQDLAALGGEHAEDTAVVGPTTYRVRPGFVALAAGDDGAELQPDPATWAAMVAALAA